MFLGEIHITQPLANCFFFLSVSSRANKNPFSWSQLCCERPQLLEWRPPLQPPHLPVLEHSSQSSHWLLQWNSVSYVATCHRGSYNSVVHRFPWPPVQAHLLELVDESFHFVSNLSSFPPTTLESLGNSAYNYSISDIDSCLRLPMFGNIVALYYHYARSCRCIPYLWYPFLFDVLQGSGRLYRETDEEDVSLRVGERHQAFIIPLQISYE